jgi:hypothetical protein
MLVLTCVCVFVLYNYYLDFPKEFSSIGFLAALDRVVN